MDFYFPLLSQSKEVSLLAPSQEKQLPQLARIRLQVPGVGLSGQTVGKMLEVGRGGVLSSFQDHVSFGINAAPELLNARD